MADRSLEAILRDLRSCHEEYSSGEESDKRRVSFAEAKIPHELLQLNRDIAACQRSIEDQQTLIEVLERDGHDVAQ